MNKKVAFLFDRDNSWIYHFFEEKYFDVKGFDFYNIFNSKEVFNFYIVFIIGYTKIL